MDYELSWLMKATRALPRVRGSGRVGTVVQKMYRRKKREPLVAPVFDFRMRLNPNELVDGALLFFPQLYDRREIALLERELKSGDIFLDVGAHIGFYSLIASRCVGENGKVISIEADPDTYDRLEENIRLNGLTNIDPVCRGISDRPETLRFGVNMNGNRGASSFLANDQPKGIHVACVPLSQIVNDRGLKRITAMKVDIEGFGVRALRKFYEDVALPLFPTWVIAEDEDGLSDLMHSRGYQALGHWGFNWIFHRP